MLAVQVDNHMVQAEIDYPLQRLRQADAQSERDFARWIVERLEAVAQGRSTPEVVDAVMTGLLIAIDADSEIALSEFAEELLFEAQTIHDYGTGFGCDLDCIRAVALKVG